MDNRLIAGFFRYHREKLNYSQTGLINDKSIVGESSLCDFENGKRTLTENQLIYLFKLIGFDYLCIKDSSDFQNEFDNAINYLCNGEVNKAIKQYRAYNNEAFNTLGTLNFLVLEYLLSSLDESISSNVELVFKHVNLFNIRQKVIFQIANSCHSKKLGNFNEAIYYLEDARSLVNNPLIKAWIQNKLGILYAMQGNYVEAIVTINDARMFFSKKLYINRLILINLNLGSIYINSNSFEKAEEFYIDAFESSLSINLISVITKSFNSLCWLYFQTNQYSKINNLLKNKPNNLVESRNTYFVLAWANYKIGNKEETVRLCKEGLQKFKDYTYVCYIYQYIEKAAMNIKTGQERLLKKIVNTEDYDRDKEIEELFTYELIDFYKRKGDFENACKYYDKLRKKA